MSFEPGARVMWAPEPGEAVDGWRGTVVDPTARLAAESTWASTWTSWAKRWGVLVRADGEDRALWIDERELCEVVTIPEGFLTEEDADRFAAKHAEWLRDQQPPPPQLS